MKKILIISSYFPPEIGAASNRIFQLAKNLKNFNYNVEVVCPFPNYPTGKILGNYRGFYHKETIYNINCHRLYIYPNNSSSSLKRFISMISFALSIWILLFKKTTNKYEEIIIQNSPIIVGFSSIILFKKFLKKSIILNVSDLWPQSAVDLGVINEESFTHKFLKKIEKFNYKNSDKFIGQSKYIINHAMNFNEIPNFLYRNIPQIEKIDVSSKKNHPISFIYAGLLGLAQGVLQIVKIMSNLELDYKFDLYGDGNQKQEIEEFLKSNPSNKITYHGSLPKTNLQQIIGKYHYSFVPLITDIKGAFPSKIYELTLHRVPMIYIGKGEAKEFIIKNNIGYCLDPNNIDKLLPLINEILNIHDTKHEIMVNNCKKISQKDLNFRKQFLKFLKFLNE